VAKAGPTTMKKIYLIESLIVGAIAGLVVLKG
jgi:hypothetical protein